MSVRDLYDCVKHMERQLGSLDSSIRGEYISKYIGACAAACAALPTQEINNPTNHWLMQCEGNLKRVLSELNEIYIIDIPLALTTARQTYLIRYNRVYDHRFIMSELCGCKPRKGLEFDDDITKAFSDLPVYSLVESINKLLN